MHSSLFLLVTVFSSAVVHAQTTPDGAIVPFSTLPACAAKCGPLFDVQGACAPPVQPTANTQCFCTDTRLTSFSQSTSNIASVCGTASCSSEADLQALQTWYEGLCKDGGSTGATTTDGGNVATTTDSSGAAVTSTKAASSGNNGGRKNQGWFSAHVKWVIFLIVIAIAIPAIWIAAIILRRRYIRKKEREIEMRPPVAIGPHQVQAMSGGYSYGDGVGVAEAGRKSGNGGREKGKGVVTEASGEAGGDGEKKGWLRKARK